MFPTTVVKVRPKSQRTCITQAHSFFDARPQRSFIHSQVISKLGLQPKRQSMVNLPASGQEPSTIQYPIVKLGRS